MISSSFQYQVLLSQALGLLETAQNGKLSLGLEPILAIPPDSSFLQEVP